MARAGGESASSPACKRRTGQQHGLHAEQRDSATIPGGIGLLQVVGGRPRTISEG